MALSDCPECWNTPCTCGYMYRNWSPNKKQELIDAINSSNMEQKFETPKPDADPVIEERISTLEDEIANVETVVDKILEVLNVISVDMKATKEKINQTAIEKLRKK